MTEGTSRRSACKTCGGPKPLGRGRQFCDDCLAASKQRQTARQVATHSAEQSALRAGAPDNGAARCRTCNTWRPAEHFTGDHERTGDHLRRTLLKRWCEKVQPAASGCWTWTGTTTDRGYGRIWDGVTSTPAYRVGYELLVGPIPAGLELDHLCRNPPCVNPAHLEPVTHAENVRRGEAGVTAAARQLGRTHCPQGHPYDDENTSIRREGWRRCKACARAYYHRKRETVT